MPHDHDEATWQPISAMPLIGGMIAGALEDTREHLATLAEARSRPHMLDDEALDRSGRVHGEQLEFVAIYEQQIGRWRAGVPSAAQVRELTGWRSRPASCGWPPSRCLRCSASCAVAALTV